MSSALRRIDIIDKAVGALRVGIIVLHGNFHIDIVFASLKIHDLIVKRGFAPVQVRNKLLDTAFVVEFPHDRLAVRLHPQIRQDDLKTLGEKSHFPKALL